MDASLSDILMLGVIFSWAKSGRFIGIANHQMQMSRRDHHSAINLVNLESALCKAISIILSNKLATELLPKEKRVGFREAVTAIEFHHTDVAP